MTVTNKNQIQQLQVKVDEQYKLIQKQDVTINKLSSDIDFISKQLAVSNDLLNRDIYAQKKRDNKKFISQLLLYGGFFLFGFNFLWIMILFLV